MRANRILLGAALLALGAGRALAAPPMSAPELEAERGGYLSVGGVSFDFGAVMQTFVDGKLAMQTGLTLSDTGVLAQQTGLGALSPSSFGAAASVAGDGGATRLFQMVSPSQLSNVVLNTASNRTISQNTAITLTIPGLDALQGQYSLQRLGSQLSQSAITNRLGR